MIQKKSFTTFTMLLACFLCGSLFFGCKQKEKPEFLFRASLIVNENHTWFQAFEYFGQTLEERSNGRMKLQVYPSEQLAKEIEAIRLIQAEVIDMTVTGSMLNNWFELAAFCELPFFFKDTIEARNFIHGPIGKEMEHQMINVTGLRPVGYFQRGPRHLTSNRPIKHPDDLQGLIVRVPNVPSFVTAWSALGAKPTPMAFSEVFTSLQQGTIEAQENPFDLIKNAGFYEVQDYINLTEHVISWGYPVIGEKQFQKLPEDLKTIFLKAAKDMQAYERHLFTENEKHIKDELAAKGMTFIEVNKDAYIKKCEDAIYSSLSNDMKKVYKKLKNP
ncbi:TRAP transporter substrate-binding protein [Postechiella marina]